MFTPCQNLIIPISSCVRAEKKFYSTTNISRVRLIKKLFQEKTKTKNFVNCLRAKYGSLFRKSFTVFSTHHVDEKKTNIENQKCWFFHSKFHQIYVMFTYMHSGSCYFPTMILHNVCSNVPVPCLATAFWWWKNTPSTALSMEILIESYPKIDWTHVHSRPHYLAIVHGICGDLFEWIKIANERKSYYNNYIRLNNHWKWWMRMEIAIMNEKINRIHWVNLSRKVHKW